MIVVVQFAAAAGIFYMVESISRRTSIASWLGGAFAMQVVRWIGEVGK